MAAKIAVWKVYVAAVAVGFPAFIFSVSNRPVQGAPWWATASMGVAGGLLGIVILTAISHYWKGAQYRRGLGDGVDHGAPRGYELGYQRGLADGMKVDTELRHTISDPVERAQTKVLFLRTLRNAKRRLGRAA